MRIPKNPFGSRSRSLRRGTARTGAAAIEFAVICPILFLIFLGMVEISRGITVAGALTNASRVGARAGSVTGGSYTSILTIVNNSLANAGLPQTANVTVTVNNVAVLNDVSFQSLAVPGSLVTVQVSMPYGSVSWLPNGATVFVSSSQLISATCGVTKEG